MESLLAIIIGAFGKRFVEAFKKWGVDPLEALVLFCLLAGVTYAVYDMFAPADVRQNVVSFVSTAGLTAVMVHETLQRINGKK